MMSVPLSGELRSAAPIRIALLYSLLAPLTHRLPLYIKA